MRSTDELRARAIARTLFPPTSLRMALRRLGFVQADPLRFHARAQDLILRHRVTGYREGDLERRYPSLGIEEDYLYAYGFVTTDVWALLHPRANAEPTPFDREVLATVQQLGSVHPRDLDAQFGKSRVVNAWGGYSKATKRALERLHHAGLLRIHGRETGIRIYAPAELPAHTSPAERIRGLTRAVVNVLDPVPERTLHALVSRLRRWVADAPDHRAVVRELVSEGLLERHEVDGIAYLGIPKRGSIGEAPRVVRFLAPFDPLVWDRARFEHLYGWQYRFEAYTPSAKRVRGYYALPLLYGDRVLGWANVTAQPEGLGVDVGFHDKQPPGRAFQRELDAEIARVEAFLRRER